MMLSLTRDRRSAVGIAFLADIGCTTLGPGGIFTTIALYTLAPVSVEGSVSTRMKRAAVRFLSCANTQVVITTVIDNGRDT